MTDNRPSENTDDYPKFPTMVGMFGARHAETPTEPSHLDALVEQLTETNRHLEAIANELRMKNRVVGL